MLILALSSALVPLADTPAAPFQEQTFGYLPLAAAAPAVQALAVDLQVIRCVASRIDKAMLQTGVRILGLLF
jgi:hypothetical protein